MKDLTNCAVEPLWEDGEFVVARVRTSPSPAAPRLMVSPAQDHPLATSLAKLENALALRSELDSEWAARPVEMIQFRGRTALVAEDPEGVFLHETIDGSLAVPEFLRLATGIASALGGLHARGLVHKDVKPANLIVNLSTGQAWLTGFGLTSRLPRHRQTPVPPEIIAGTLAYMAPEQTGRMNRSVDSRSDLYSLGVTLYEMLSGSLPFTAGSPMEWVHCHTARLPVSPGERVSNVPATISAIIMKLLAKTAEERYQSAAGVAGDLRRCLSEWETRGQISDFALGELDTPDRLLIPERLYGRDREVDTLLGAFERIVAGRGLELVLVSGYSGIGKSAVVNELHKPLVPPRGLFASGKFDQYKRDIPYATLAQAFRSLTRPLLSKSEEQLSPWREALREALIPHGALVVELVPELLHIIGEQPPVPELSPRDAQARFHMVLRRFLNVFARAEHPLALFLDDLQWLDAATLDFLEHLLSRTDLQHLLLIGAYRDNEVHSTHPLMRKLDAMRRAGAILHDIVLTPLGREDLVQLLADSLRCESSRTAPLAHLIHEKTSGNPFFAIQFIGELAEKALLTFDHTSAQWSWDLPQIRAMGFTDNVVDLMVGKLSRLPLETQRVLQQFACLGNSAEFTMLQMVHPGAAGEMHEHLWKAVRDGLVSRAETSYRFLHDRVQEAAYSLIPEEQRAQAHLRIGRLLAEHTPPEHRDEAIFEIVNQLNRGLHLVISAEERERVAGLDLIAAKRAKVSTAYDSALKYLEAGRSLLSEETWEQNYDLIFSIECLTAECELLTAQMAAAEKRLAMLAPRAKTRHDFAVVTRLQLTLYTTLDRSELAIDISLEYLRREGTEWSRHPTWDEVIEEYNRVWSRLGDRQIEGLADLPRLTDPDIIDLLDVCTEFVHPAMFYDENLSTLVVCRMVNLSLEHGNCDASAFGYVWLAMFVGPRFNNYRQGFRFGQLGYDLVETRGFTRYQARTYLSFATLTPWARHAANGRELVRSAFDVAYRMGDLTFTTYSWHALITNYLMVGDSLKIVQAEAEKGLAFATKTGFGLVVANCETQLGLIRTLRGLTPTFGCFDDENFNEAKAELHYASNPVLVLSECFYWTRKLQARFFAGDYTAAVEYSQKAQQMLWTAASQVETGDFRYYAALAHAAAWSSAPADEQQRLFGALRQHGRQLEIWAEHCPENFENRAALANAEIARIEGRVLDAEHLYEKAIQSAHGNGFIHNEALGHELAARFYQARGFKTIADAYLKNAHACYGQWGAQGKVAQLEARYPHLKVAPVAGVAIDSPVTQMDADIVIKASQTLSHEINLTSLIEKLVRLAVEYAGAQRGLLILLHGDVPFIEGEAKFENGRVVITIRRVHVRPSDLLQAALQYGLRTRERVVFDDASSHPMHSGEEYVKRCGLRSVLCLPILKQTQVIGALYLENNLTAHAFSAARVAVLEALASHAAISLENARLYAALERENQERKRIEGELGLIFDNIPGLVVILNASGAVEFENDRTREYLGPALASTREWASNGIVCPDDIPRVFPIFGAGIASGAPFEYDVRLRHESGAYRWFLLRAHPLRNPSGSVARWYVLLSDIEDRKQAEVVRASEHRLNEMINAIPTSVWTTRPDGYCDFLNQRWLHYAGMSEEDAQGWGWHATIHPDDAPRLVGHWQACLAAGTPVDMEGRIRRADGVYRWFLFRGNPLRDEAGKILRWFGTNIDIEDRKQAEAIRASEHHLRTIVNSIPGLVCTMSPAGEVQELNQQLLEYFGRTPENLRGWAMTDAVHPDDLPRVVAAFSYSVSTGTPYDVEHRCRRADGVYRWFQIRARPVRDADGQIAGWYVLLTDIEERKLAEEAVRANELHLNQIINTIPTMAWSALPDGSCDFFNQTWLQFTGFMLEQALGWGWTTAFHPDDLQEDVLAYWQSCLTTGTPVDTELRMRRHDGVYRWFLLRAAPLRDDSGNILKWFGTNVDIEDRRHAENALRASERNLQQTIDTIPALAWSARTDGSADFFSKHYLEYVGLASEAVQNTGWLSAVHAEDLHGLIGAWQKAMATNEPGEHEARLRRFDGEYRWFLFRTNPMRDDSGNIVKWYGNNTDIDDLKRAEEKLRRSEAFLAEGQRVSLTGSFSWHVDRNLITFSEEACRIFGFPPDEPVTLERIGERVHPDDLPTFATKTEEARTTGADHDYGIRIRMPDGTVKFLHSISHAVRDGEAGLEYIGTLQDVTSRHLAEELVRKSELHLRQMTETIPEMLWSATPEGMIDYCNGRLLEYSALTAEDVMGTGWTKLLHPDDVEHTAKVWLSCVATGTPYVVEVRTFHAADRTYRWCLTNAIPLLDSQGRILKWYGTVVDMHDRKHAEAELRRSEARKTAILDSALDCIVTIDHEGQITEFNPAAERTFGYRREEVLGKLFAEVVVPHALRERYEEVASQVTTGKTELIGRRFELSAVRADGSEFPIEVAITRIRSDGSPSFTGYLRDITDRKRAEEELRRSEVRLREVQDELAHVTRVTTMGELAASIAHEVNQPIAGVVINGNACLRWLSRLQEDSVNLREARETIQRIIRDGNRAGEIIARIRALFKKTELAKEPIDLHETIREIIELAQNEIDKQRVVLRLELSAGLPRVLGDRVQLQQVMLNLILNAIDAMATIQSRKRELVILTRRSEEREVVVTVSDSGIGLRSESMEDVFRAFHTTKPGGLGMGLSISRSIVENHAGRLWAESHDGPGASFHFSLPIVSVS